MGVEHRIVDNRVFLLGLDYLYREAMKNHERGELLACGREVAEVLGVSPADVPIEGYYGEEPKLTTYFQVMRALQDVDAERQGEVALLTPFLRLREIASAPLYGRARDVGKLLPVGRDPLTQALEDNWPDLTIVRLMSAAAACAREWDDFSLVGMAARWGDPVTVAALRESVVLYAEFVALGIPPRYRYVWQVDAELVTQASRFIVCFNRLFDNELPPAVAHRAKTYWNAYESNHIFGRCVMLGSDDTTPPIRHYHWAIRSAEDRGLTVHAFWDTEIWTTDRYRRRAMHEMPPHMN
jgi:hypothetical protein